MILEPSPRPCIQMRIVKILVQLLDILASGVENSNGKKDSPTHDLGESSENDLSDDYMLDDDDISRAHNRTVEFNDEG